MATQATFQMIFYATIQTKFKQLAECMQNYLQSVKKEQPT